MKTYAYTVNLKDSTEAIADYKFHHDNIWPEVAESLKAVGILELRIWLHGRRLFMVLDTVDAFDPAIDFPRYLTLHPKCQEWEDLMSTYQEPVSAAKPGEKWSMMEQVFSL